MVSLHLTGSFKISSKPGIPAIILFMSGLDNIICLDCSNFSGSLMYSWKSGLLIIDCIISIDSFMLGIPSPSPPGIIFMISSNWSESIPDCLSMSAIKFPSPPPPPAEGEEVPLLTSPLASTVAEAADDDDEDDFFLLLVGTILITLPSSTPISSNTSEGFNFLPPNKTPCLALDNPAWSSTLFCNSRTVDTLGIVYFFAT
mmetsp:Transcript_31892/g.46486  ORF Transcript_31892/g.46486 Transcript_31892/m.46486 type:complete len:201 (+) Transcript_31892:507-1109(+)